MKNKIPKDYFTRNIETKIEVKENEGKKFLYGFIPYNTRSVNMGGIREIITPSAFTKSIQESNIVALVNHDTDKILGSTKNNTLTLESRDDGLFIQAEIPNTTYGNDAYEILSRGDIDTMSFGFSPIQVETRDGIDYLKEVKLYEVSFMVAFPAYEDTSSVALTRTRFNQIKEKRSIDLEKIAEVLNKEKFETEDINVIREFNENLQTIIIDNTEKIVEEPLIDNTQQIQLSELNELVKLELIM
jgi:HK97 family phage prohead protease